MYQQGYRPQQQTPPQQPPPAPVPPPGWQQPYWQPTAQQPPKQGVAPQQGYVQQPPYAPQQPQYSNRQQSANQPRPPQNMPPPGWQAPIQPPSQPPRTQQRKRKKRGIGLIVLVGVLAVAIAGGIYGMAYMNVYNQVKPFENVFLNNIYIDDIALGGMTPDEAVAVLQKKVSERQTSWNVNLIDPNDGHVILPVNNATLGISTDTNEIYVLLNEAIKLGHTGSTYDRKRDMDALAENPYRRYTTQSSSTDQHLDEFLKQIYYHFYKDPVNAAFVDFKPDAADPFIISKEQYGEWVDVNDVKSQIYAMAASGTSGDIVLKKQFLKPAITEADVRKTVALRSTGITQVSKDSSAERTQNIRVAFAKYNGLVLEPGKSVSFNTLVGARTRANGFQDALEYVNGDLVMGTGGGVCQASTTIYLAALTAGLKIDKRTPHSDKVSYTIFGQDATVYYSDSRKIDFVFSNNTSGKIYITAHVESIKSGKNTTYQCVVKIYGQSLEDISYRLKTVENVELIPAPITVKRIKDTKGEHGVYYVDEEVTTRKARAGFINETYLVTMQKGIQVGEPMFISRDRCEAREEIVYYGTVKR